jgi:hypothetical protein
MPDSKILEFDAPKEPIHLQGDNLLASLIGNHADVFKDTYFHKHPCVFRNKIKSKRLSLVKEELAEFDIETLLGDSASESIHVWLASRDSKPLDSIKVDDKQAFKLYNAGHSLYCRAPMVVENLLIGSILHSLGYGVTSHGNDRFSRGEVEMFYARQGHITDFHTDFQENITIQLTGSKKWIFGRSTLDHPIRGVTPHFQVSPANSSVPEQQLKTARLCDTTFNQGSIPHFNTESLEFFEEVIIHAGDVLYHPAGIWHRVECTQDSLSMNLSLTTASYADVFCAGLHQILLKNKTFRGGVLSDPMSRQTSLRTMSDIIKAIPGILQDLHPCDLLPLPTLYSDISSEKKDCDYEDLALGNEEDEEEEEVEEESQVETIVSTADYDSTDFTDQCTYKFNPLVEVLLESDLEPLGWRRSRQIEKAISTHSAEQLIPFIVHSSYGTEDFESLTRIVCLVPREALNVILKLKEICKFVPFSKTDAINTFAPTAPNRNIGNKKRKQGASLLAAEAVSADLLKRILWILVKSGVLSILGGGQEAY